MALSVRIRTLYSTRGPLVLLRVPAQTELALNKEFKKALFKLLALNKVCLNYFCTSRYQLPLFRGDRCCSLLITNKEVNLLATNFPSSAVTADSNFQRQVISEGPARLA